MGAYCRTMWRHRVLDGWDIMLNMLLMALTGTIIILLSTLKEVMINEYKKED